MIKTSLPQKRRKKMSSVLLMSYCRSLFFENVDSFVFYVKENKYSEI